LFSVLSFGSKSLRFVVNALARFCKSIFEGVVFPDSNSTILLVGILALFEISSSERLEISLKYFRSADVDFSTGDAILTAMFDPATGTGTTNGIYLENNWSIIAGEDKLAKACFQRDHHFTQLKVYSLLFISTICLMLEWSLPVRS
jgi:hypothetical protein